MFLVLKIVVAFIAFWVVFAIIYGVSCALIDYVHNRVGAKKMRVDVDWSEYKKQLSEKNGRDLFLTYMLLTGDDAVKKEKSHLIEEEFECRRMSPASCCSIPNVE